MRQREESGKTSTVERQVIQKLLGLSVHDLNAVLIQYALELTILARAHFLEGDFESAKDCNESLHRILGFVEKRLKNKSREQVDSMVDAVVASAAKKARLQILLDSIQRAKGIHNQQTAQKPRASKKSKRP